METLFSISCHCCLYYETIFIFQALIKATKDHFGADCDFIGCRFHWKQASTQVIGFGRTKDSHYFVNGQEWSDKYFTYHTCIRHCRYIRAHFNEGEHFSKFDIFWKKYFIDTWIGLYKPNTWNIYDVLNDPNQEDILVNQTNNPLEGHNKEWMGFCLQKDLWSSLLVVGLMCLARKSGTGIM